MATRRYGERPRRRAPGAGRPRRVRRTVDGPVDDEIVGVAARLFARHGVAGTTMAQIADASGLAVSSIYYYFANKYELLDRIVTEVNQQPLAIADAAAMRFADAPRRLHAFVRNDAAALCELSFDINEVHRLAGDDRANLSRYWEDRRRLVSRVQGFVAQGVAAGDFVEVDVELTARSILANDEAIQNWYRPPASDGDALMDPGRIGSFVADLGLRALLRDPAALAAISNDTAVDLNG